MRINPVNYLNFGKGQCNVAVTSDNHGQFGPMANMFSNLIHNKRQVFENSGQRGVKNLLLFGGDWFMDPGKKGYISDPNATNGYFQLEFFNELVGATRKAVSKDLEAIVTPGNHDFDNGDKMWYNYASRMDATVVLTNFSPRKALGLKTERLGIRYKDNLKTKKIIEIQDDKNPDLKHKVLVLGALIPGMEFYSPGQMEHIKIHQDTNQKDANIPEQNLLGTYSVLRKEIKKFKKENPNGVVIVLSHTGTRISELIAQKVDGIDILFNGHEHADGKTRTFGNTRVIDLGQNSSFFKSFKIKFDDNGYFINRDEEEVKYESDAAKELFNNRLKELADYYFTKDNEPLYTISGPQDELSAKDIRIDRYNKLAHFITSAALETLQKADPSIQMVAIASSAMRQNLPVNKPFTNIQIKNLVTGQYDAISKVYTVEMSGKDIAKVVYDYMKAHQKAPKSSGLTQWAGLDVDTDRILKIFEEKGVKATTLEDIEPCIKYNYDVKNYDKSEPIDFHQSYKIAFPNSFICRPKMMPFVELQDKAQPFKSKLISYDDSIVLDDLIQYSLWKHIEAQDLQIADNGAVIPLK